MPWTVRRRAVGFSSPRGQFPPPPRTTMASALPGSTGAETRAATTLGSGEKATRMKPTSTSAPRTLSTCRIGASSARGDGDGDGIWQSDLRARAASGAQGRPAARAVASAMRYHPHLVCGIAGFFMGGTPRDPHPILGRMLQSLRHRGPDDAGAHVDAHVALGARRL